MDRRDAARGALDRVTCGVDNAYASCVAGAPRRRTGKPRAKRGTLSVEAIVAAAVELADESGLEALTMRQLATRLGVEPMSLYTHIRAKHDLEVAMVAHVMATTPDVAGEGGWEHQLRDRAQHLRHVIHAHRWIFPLLLRVGYDDEVYAAAHEATLAALRGAGLDAATALRAYQASMRLAYGMVGAELAAAADDDAFAFGLATLFAGIRAAAD
jgi:AcrR family transcriptional regulator